MNRGSQARTSYRSAETAFAAPVLVLGIGNILLKDEGVGVHVVEAMKNMTLPEGVELLDGGTSGFDLVDAIANRQKLIVIDAMDADEAPGTIRRLTIDDLVREKVIEMSIHEFGLLDTWHTAKMLGLAPQAVVIYGVQPKEVRPGLKLSDEVQKTIPTLIEKLFGEIERKDCS